MVQRRRDRGLSGEPHKLTAMASSHVGVSDIFIVVWISLAPYVVVQLACRTCRPFLILLFPTLTFQLSCPFQFAF